MPFAKSKGKIVVVTSEQHLLEARNALRTALAFIVTNRLHIGLPAAYDQSFAVTDIIRNELYKER